MNLKNILVRAIFVISSIMVLLIVHSCGVDDGLGKAGQTEEEFFTVIETPLDLQVSATASDSVSLVWLDMSTDEDGFAIFRREDAAAEFSPVAVVAADVTAFVDTNVADDMTYHYYLRALRGPFISDATDVATGTTPPIPAVPPAAPTSLVPTVLSDVSIIVTWSDVADETGFVIEYSDETNNPGVWNPVSVTAGTIAYVFGTFSNSTTYAFRVKAINDIGDSPYTTSTPATVTTNAAPPPLPAAPSNLTAQTLQYQDVRLDWADNSSVEEEYIVRRDGVEIGRVSLNTTTYTDYNILAGSYNYSVTAINTTGESSPVTITGVVMPSAPAAPSALGVSHFLTTFTLYWTDNSNNEDGFRVYLYPVSCLSITRTTKATLLSTEPANDTGYLLFSKANPPPGTSVCIFVQAFNDGGVGSSTKLQYSP